MRQTPHTRDAYCWFADMPTRWADNDVYGHVNNTAYYGFFDSAVNRFLIEKNALDIEIGDQIGLVVQTSCAYFAPLSFPNILSVGVRAERVGRTSVTYGLGVFGAGQNTASAQGRFVHVYVDRQSRKPKSLNENLRRAVMSISRPRSRTAPSRSKITDAESRTHNVRPSSARSRYSSWCASRRRACLSR